MAVKGVFASDSNIQGTRKGDFASALLQTVPTGSAPFFALSSGMKSKDATDTVVTWFEENHLAGRTTITNNAGTGTTMTFSDASLVIAGQIYLVESTGEHVYVDSVSGSNATVTRGFAGTTAQAVNGSGTPEPLQLVSRAYEEGSAKPTAIANVGFPRFNYTQTFRNAWDVTGTARAVEYHTGDIVAKNKRDASLFHAEDIERAIIWGKKAFGTLNGKPFHTLDGIQAQLSTHLQSQATNVTYKDINNFLQGIFETNIKGQPNERIAFCGNEVLRVIGEIARLEGTDNLQPGQTDFGFKIRTWFTPFGDVTLMTHPLMVESPLWTKDLLVIHPAAVRMRWLRRTTEDNYDRDGTRAGADADFGVITSELSIEYMAEKTGGYFDGIDTSAAAQ